MNEIFLNSCCTKAFSYDMIMTMVRLNIYRKHRRKIMMDNNLFDKDNQNGEQGQFQQQPYQQTQQPYQSQQPYQQPYQPQQPYQMGDSELEEPVTFADWMLTMLVMCIPCANIIMMFVWAFGSDTKKSKSNYFKARLVWMAIWCVLSIVMVGVFSAALAALIEAIQNGTLQY